MLARYCFICSILVACNISLFAKPVSLENALFVAEKVFDSQPQRYARSQSTDETDPNERVIRLLDTKNRFLIGSKETPAFYIFDSESNGFVIISADDTARPILAVSEQSNIDLTRLPRNLNYLLTIYQKQIESAVLATGSSKNSPHPEWADLLSNSEGVQLYTTGSFLLTTTWDQAPYYNNLCPIEPGSLDQTLTGCVATAMAQIMKYWQFPQSGLGSSRYEENQFGVLSANHENTTFRWANMPSELSELSSADQVNAVSTLMYHCGVSVHMDYDTYTNSGSGANPSLVPDAFITHFDYSRTATLIKKNETTDSIWHKTIRNEIDDGRPVFYGGYGPEGNGGHAWICDGYTTSGYYHMNWGWGSASNANGFFALSALDFQEDDGITSFSYNQMAIIGIQPPQQNTAGDLSLYSQPILTTNIILQGEGISIDANVENKATNSFSGYIAAGVFDQNNTLVSLIQEYSIENLPSGSHYIDPITFSSTKSTLSPGNYTVSILYRRTYENVWKRVSSGMYTDRVNLTVSQAETNLNLYSPLAVGEANIIQQNLPFDLSFNVINQGTIDFTGQVAVDFFNLDGTWRSDIGTIYQFSAENLQPNHRYSNDLAASVEGVNIQPGEYYVALTHKEDGKDYWEFTEAGNYVNPIRVLVQEGPDIYEPNDDTFYAIHPVFVGDVAYFSTTGASIHDSNDDDLFNATLPQGFDYVIDCRVNDSWESSNGVEYTTDVFMVLIASNDAEGVYDDKMKDPLILSNGGWVALGVFPWSENQGTYNLEITITRTPLGTGLDPQDPRNYLQALHRFYRNDSDSFFFTASEAEKTGIIQTQPSDIWLYEKISHRVLNTALEGTIPVYRLFYREHGSHLYTTSLTEAQQLESTSNGQIELEGTAFYVYPSAIKGAQPVYSFFSPITLTQFFTISEAEKKNIIATISSDILEYTGISWYAFE